MPPETLAGVLRRSDLHLYLTVPFVASWSLFNALSTGLVVLGADVEPVRELIEPEGQRAARAALRRRPDGRAGPRGSSTTRPEFAPLGEAGRRMIDERYGIDASIPPLKGFFERVAGR